MRGQVTIASTGLPVRFPDLAGITSVRVTALPANSGRVMVGYAPAQIDPVTGVVFGPGYSLAPVPTVPQGPGSNGSVVFRGLTELGVFFLSGHAGDGVTYETFNEATIG